MPISPFVFGYLAIGQLTQQKLQVPGVNQSAEVFGRETGTELELVLVDLMYGSLRLTNSLTVLQGRKGIRYLPVRQFSQLLNFHLFVAPSTGTVSGFLTTPADRFELKAKSGLCKRKGTITTFGPDLCFEQDGDLYIESETLALLLGLQLNWRLSRLELEVKSESPLDVRATQLASSDSAPQHAALPLERVVAPYRFFSIPAMDLQFLSSVNHEDTASSTSNSLALNGIGDLGYFEAKYRLGMGSNHLFNAGISLGREDSSGHLLGILGATKFEFGDLQISPISLLARGRSGLGFAIARSKLPNHGQVYGEKIEGHAPAGSRVEIYRNDRRLATCSADASGRYEFSEILLESGQNKFLISVMTPDGEVLQEDRVLYSDTTGPGKGQSSYQMWATQLDESVFGLGKAGRSGSGNEVGGQFQFGLSSGTWFSATMAQYSSSPIGGSYFGAGVHTWKGQAQLHLNAMSNDTGGSAISAGFSQRLGNSMVSLEHTRLNGNYRELLIPENETVADSVTKLRIDGNMRFGANHVSYGLNAERISGLNPSTAIRTRVSGGNADTYVSNSLSARISEGPMSGSGAFQIRKKVGRSSLRADIVYGVGSNAGIHGARLGLDRSIATDYRIRFGLEMDDRRSSKLSGFGTVYRAFGPLFLGLNLNADFLGHFSIGLMLTAAVIGEDSLDSLQWARSGIGEHGSTTVHVFLDKNLNGKFDEGDAPLQDIGIRIGRNALVGKTDANGYCTLYNLQPNEELIVGLNETTFEDPGWVSEQAAKILVLRRGSHIQTSFAIVETAEFEGHIFGIENSTGLRVELVDEKGELQQVSYVDSEFDYVFCQVREGKYTMKLKDSAGVVLAEKSIRAERGSYLRGVDFEAKLESEP